MKIPPNNLLLFNLDGILYSLACLTFLCIYLPTDLIFLPPFRVSEVLVFLQLLLYLCYRNRQSFHLNNTFFSILTYYIICFFTLLFTLTIIPSDQISFALHLFLYSCLPLVQFLIICNIRIANLSLFYKIFSFTVIFALFFSLYSQYISYSGVAQISTERFSNDYLSLENEFKQAQQNTGIINYLGNTNGRCYNLSFLMICFAELIPLKISHRVMLRLSISLLLLLLSLISLSRGAFLIISLYLIFSILTLLVPVVRTRTISKNLFLLFLPFTLLLPLAFNLLFKSQVFSVSLYYLDNKSDAFGRFDQLVDLWSSTSDLLLFGKGYLYPYFNEVTSGIGQSTWLEILLSTGLISLIGYFSLIFSMASLPLRFRQYKSFVLVVFSFILLLGMTVHYVDKIPRIMLAYSIILGMLSSSLIYSIKKSQFHEF